MLYLYLLSIFFAQIYCIFLKFIECNVNINYFVIFYSYL